MSRPSPRRAAVPLLLAGLLLAGCTTSSNILTVQSKYAYPNGDYEMLGRASAEAKHTRFLSAPVMDREAFLQLEQQALASKPGADLLVDYLVSSDVTQLPLLSLATFRLEGTAVRFRELGGQSYRDAPATPASRGR